jgi:acyl-CoA reductase-like NAD-dependent aldehyde dehydrogenase
MKALEVLNQIKGILGIELSEQKVQLATMKLDNGTEIEAEEFVADKEVFIVGEEGEKIALPVGDYTLEDGKILSVVEEGLIAEIKDAAEEEAPVEEAKEEVEAEAEDAKVKSKTESTQVVYATKEEVDEVKSMIAEIKTLLEKEPIEEIAEVELSAEVVEPIAHNPEAATEQKTNLNQNTNSHISRIRQMIYNQ